VAGGEEGGARGTGSNYGLAGERKGDSTTSACGSVTCRARMLEVPTLCGPSARHYLVSGGQLTPDLWPTVVEFGPGEDAILP